MNEVIHFGQSSEYVDERSGRVVITMGDVARKAEKQAGLKAEKDCESSDTRVLDEIEVLKCLEPDQLDEEDGRPARGIVYGVAFGAILWAIIIAAYTLATTI